MIYFDLDNTLIRTHHLRGYMTNPAGRDFLIKNPNAVNTSLVENGLVELIRDLGDNAAIITNSPKAYAEAMLSKHGFSSIKLIASANKPCTDFSLSKDSIYIGDEPRDILFAHEQGIPSIAFTPGAFFPESKIETAQPTAIAKNLNELERLLSEKLYFEERRIENLVPLRELPNEEIKIESLGEYYSPKHQQFRSSGSNLVLTFKTAKNYTLEEIKRNQQDLFYYNGVKGGAVFHRLISDFCQRLKLKIDSMNLIGRSVMIGLPNSMPEFAYLSDTNYRLAKDYNQNDSQRNIYRLKPVKEAHLTGVRRSAKHIGTLGISSNPSFDNSIDNIILFDDITTTGIQFNCAAKLLREAGYQNNIVGLALAKTILTYE